MDTESVRLYIRNPIRYQTSWTSLSVSLTLRNPNLPSKLISSLNFTSLKDNRLSSDYPKDSQNPILLECKPLIRLEKLL